MRDETTNAIWAMLVNDETAHTTILHRGRELARRYSDRVDAHGAIATFLLNYVMDSVSQSTKWLDANSCSWGATIIRTLINAEDFDWGVLADMLQTAINDDIQIGNRVRSYDSEMMDDCFIEGTVIGFREYEGCTRYVIDVDRTVVGGDVNRTPDNFQVIPPVNGTPRSLGGECDSVKRIG